MGKVEFVEITKEKYDLLITEGEVSGYKYNPDAVYFVKDTGQLYKGEDLYSGTTAVSKEGTVAEVVASNINFVGKGFTVESDPDNPGRVNVSMPFNLAKMTASNYNSTGGNTAPSVADISKAAANSDSTANTYQTRYVALPSDESYLVPSTWTTTAERNVLNKTVTSISYTTSDFFWLVDKTSTKFRITLIKGDGTEVSEVTGVITGPGTYSTTNCSVVISSSNWSEDFMGYKAKATVNVGVAGMLGGAGKFNVKITHLNGGSEYSKEQKNLFYDDNPGAGSIESGSIVLKNKTNTKWLSGVEYYGPGTTVDVTLNNITGVFDKSFESSVGTIKTNCTADISYTAADVATAAGVTLATTKNNTTATSLVKSGVSISGSKYLTDIRFTSATCGNGWNTNTLSTESITTIDKDIDTYAAASTSTNEAFTDENYRIKYDSINSKWASWVSTEALGSTDLKCGEGTKVFKNSTDTTTEHIYYRTFGGTQSSSVGILTLTGTNITETNFVTNKYFDMQISLDGSKWYSIRNLATEDTGITGVSGIRAQKATYNLDKTTKQIYYAFPAGINTDTNTGVAGKVSKYGIFFKLIIKNPTVVVDNISIEFK